MTRQSMKKHKNQLIFFHLMIVDFSSMLALRSIMGTMRSLVPNILQIEMIVKMSNIMCGSTGAAVLLV